jgi:hypothetical protein
MKLLCAFKGLNETTVFKQPVFSNKKASRQITAFRRRVPATSHTVILSM